MTKNLFADLAAYNVWANHKLLFHIQQMEEQHWYAEVPSSFNSLYKTILHMWDAESSWWQRMRLHEHIVVPSANFEPSLKDAANGLLHQSMQWEPFIREVMDEQALASKLIYKNSRGEQFFQPVTEVLFHVFNHSTYHRGQLVTMLRALGEVQVPQTDFIVYARRAESAS